MTTTIALTVAVVLLVIYLTANLAERFGENDDAS